jgi:hypothetical protein
MEIDSYYFLPSLWELYEKQFLGYFPQHPIVFAIRVAFLRSITRKLCSHLIIYRIHVKDQQADHELHQYHQRPG